MTQFSQKWFLGCHNFFVLNFVAMHALLSSSFDIMFRDDDDARHRSIGTVEKKSVLKPQFKTETHHHHHPCL